MPIKLYDILPKLSIKAESELCHPAERPEVAHYDDPAVWVLTDFTKSTPYTITPHEAIPAALTEMKACRVHALLVINEDKQFIGLVTSEDILGEKPVKIIQERRIPRNEIHVHSVMTPLDQLLAFSLSQIETAKVGNIAHSLVESKQHYALVMVDSEQGRQLIRGIFSLSDISDKLGYNVRDKLASAESVAELQETLTS